MAVLENLHCGTVMECLDSLLLCLSTSLVFLMHKSLTDFFPPPDVSMLLPVLLFLLQHGPELFCCSNSLFLFSLLILVVVKFHEVIESTKIGSWKSLKSH